MVFFTERLKDLRERKNLSQEKMAEELGVTRGALSSWECGRTEPNLATLDKLADFFEVTTDYLLGRQDVVLMVDNNNNNNNNNKKVSFITEAETNFLNLYRKFSERTKNVAQEILQSLLQVD